MQVWAGPVRDQDMKGGMAGGALGNERCLALRILPRATDGFRKLATRASLRILHGGSASGRTDSAGRIAGGAYGFVRHRISRVLPQRNPWKRVISGAAGFWLGTSPQLSGAGDPKFGGGVLGQDMMLVVGRQVVRPGRSMLAWLGAAGLGQRFGNGGRNR